MNPSPMEGSILFDPLNFFFLLGVPGPLRGPFSAWASEGIPRKRLQTSIIGNLEPPEQRRHWLIWLVAVERAL